MMALNIVLVDLLMIGAFGRRPLECHRIAAVYAQTRWCLLSV